jgi:TonB-dependent starch-binding outer membrane protein SusC
VDYAYADKYLLGATIRRDGVSVFFPGRQWGTFPSVSAGWRISQEDFLKGVSWLNDLKLRGSYGETGFYANTQGTNAYNTYEYYVKNSSNLLFPIALPSTLGGASAPNVNSGNIRNSGVDISATFHDAVGKDFKFSVTANIGAYKNKITSLTQTQYLFAGSRIGEFVEEAVGLPIGEFYGYKVAGIYQNASQVSSLPGYSGAIPGSYIYQDVNGDGKIDANDRTAIGSPSPNFTYGLNLNAAYKNFDFSMVLYGSQGNKDFNYVRYWTDTYHSFPGGKDIDLLNNSAVNSNGLGAASTYASGTVTNPSATQQALQVSSTPPSTFYVEDGSFLKCRVAQIGYTFDPGLLKSLGVSKLHVYIQGTNLFTITKYSGLDPELVPSVNNQNQGGANPQQSASFGVDWGAYPANQKQYLLGVNLTF